MVYCCTLSGRIAYVVSPVRSSIRHSWNGIPSLYTDSITRGSASISPPRGRMRTSSDSTTLPSSLVTSHCSAS